MDSEDESDEKGGFSCRSGDIQLIAEVRTLLTNGASIGHVRNKVYKTLNLLVSPSQEGYEVSGAFCTGVPCG